MFSIEFESDFFSVFSAFLPTVSLAFVVSTAGVSFFSTGLFFNFDWLQKQAQTWQKLSQNLKD